MHDTHYTNYHRLYDNDAFTALRTLIIADLENNPTISEEAAYERSGEPTTHRLINLVIDSAIEASGEFPYPNARFMELANLASTTLNPDTTQAIGQYLKRFDPDGIQTVSKDFMAHVTATSMEPFGDYIEMLIDLTSDLHSPEGRAAHYLLIVSKQASAAAALLLEGNHDDYLVEKLRLTQNHLNYALSELKNVARQPAPTLLENQQ